MNTIKPMPQLIEERISCRTYDPVKIPQDKINVMSSLVKQLNEEAISPIRFALINVDSSETQKPIKLGSYGIISGAQTYLIAVMETQSGDPLELGFLFEKLVLKATDQDLGTVWMGGTFDRKDFEKQLDLKDHEILAIVSPLGVPKQKRSLIDSAMRFGAGSKHRKPWEDLFFDQDFKTPLKRETAQAYAQVLDLVRLAPSASNKQPWRIVKKEGFYHLYLERTPGYAQMMRYDLQLNDIGIAKCHFELSCQGLGLQGKWVEADPKLQDPSRQYVLSWMISE